MCTSPMTKRTVDLNAPPTPAPAPFIQQGADPRAVGYAAGIAARRGSPGLPKYEAPVGGGPGPAMPALEQPFQAGRTMAEQAQRTRGQDYERTVQSAVQQHVGAGIVVPDGPMAPPPPAQGRPQLLPGDTLPQEATQDPQFQQGFGSLVAISQPHLAAKYGVIRNGQHLTPHDLANGGQVARQGQGGPQEPRRQRSMSAIAQDLNTVLNAQSAPARAQAADDDGPTPPAGLPRSAEEAEQQAAAGPGAAASRAGKSPVAPVLDPEQIDQMEDEDFDYDGLRRQMLSDILKNPNQRKIIESRLSPMDIEDLIMHNKIRQRVPVRPGKFEPEFESMPGVVELQLKQLLVKESKSVAVTEAYLLDKYAVMTTTAGTVSINGRPIPSMYDQRGDFSEELFWAKFNWMLKQNIHVLASLGINYSWFEQRVRALMVADEGKDG